MGKVKTLYEQLDLEYEPYPKPDPGDTLVQENNPNILNIQETLYMKPDGNLYGIMNLNGQKWKVQYG